MKNKNTCAAVAAVLTLLAVSGATLADDGTAPPALAPAPAAAMKPFYFQDFSTVDDGMIPDGWIGAGTLVVKNSVAMKGQKVLAKVKNGAITFTVPDLAFPPNWRCDFVTRLGDYGRARFQIGAIDVSFDLDTYHSYLSSAGARVEIDRNRFNNPILISVEFVDPVVKVYVATEQLLVSRLEETSPPQGIAFEGDLQEFGLYRITCTPLAPRVTRTPGS
jgi:hypothetical protein